MRATSPLEGSLSGLYDDEDFSNRLQRVASPVRAQRLGAAAAVGASTMDPGEAAAATGDYYYGRSEGAVGGPMGGGVLAGEGIGSGKVDVFIGYRTLVEELSMTGAQFLDLVVR